MTRSIKNLIAAILIAISCYLAWTEIWPDYAVTSFLKERIEEKNVIVLTKAELVQKVEALRNEMGAKYSEFQRLALVLPEEVDLSEIITALESIATSSGVNLPEVELGSVKNKDGEKIGEVSFKSNFRGTYQQLLTFFGYMERNIRLFDVSTFNILIVPETEDDPDPLLNVTLEGKFYWLQEVENDRSIIPPAGE